ncbi:hypothetical protein BGZ98_000342, partial [Dissophora globulifera]
MASHYHASDSASSDDPHHKHNHDPRVHSKKHRRVSDHDHDHDHENENDDHDNDNDHEIDNDDSSHSRQDGSQSPNSKMATLIGKKPNPASPALRKEQNRAAQRAFRDRKERHLQQLENMIRDLKEQQFHITARFQREVQQLKAHLDNTITENHYLREV